MASNSGTGGDFDLLRGGGSGTKNGGLGCRFGLELTFWSEK